MHSIVAFVVLATIAPPVVNDTIQLGDVRTQYPAVFDSRGTLHPISRDHWLRELADGGFLVYLYAFGTESGRLAQISPDDLWADETLDSLFLPLVARLLDSRGDLLEGYTPPPRRIVSVAEVHNTASQFFYLQPYEASYLQPRRMSSHMVHVVACGPPDIWCGDPVRPRDAPLEALIYATIVANFETMRPVLSDVLDDLLTGISAEDQLERLPELRDQYYERLRQRDFLVQLIMPEYERRRTFLPFTIQ